MSEGVEQKTGGQKPDIKMFALKYDMKWPGFEVR